MDCGSTNVDLEFRPKPGQSRLYIECQTCGASGRIPDP